MTHLPANPTPLSLPLCLFLFSVSLSTQRTLPKNDSFSVSFPLFSLPLSPRASLNLSSWKSDRIQQSSLSDYRSSFKYSTALIVALPIGTPPQTQQLVLDTGSQLSWIQCQNKRAVSSTKKPPPSATASFNPSLSTSFSFLPCTHPLCKPRVPDYSVPTTCDDKRLCHYSYFYADGTLAEGNLVREKLALSNSRTTPPLILGCSSASGKDRGILGMNLGRLSFASQAKISKFSYCVPARGNRPGPSPTGALYLGENPNSRGFKYVSLLTFSQSQRLPNLDASAYTVPLQGIRIGPKRLNISRSVFRPDASGSGQTMMDSGSEFTYLVDEAYDRVREEVARLAGPRLKKKYASGTGADMCFEGADGAEIGRLVGSVALEFEGGVEMVVEGERVLSDMGGGEQCIGVGRSSMLGAANNVIGNVHQQNYWIEYDLANRRLGFGKADCSRSA